MDGKESLNNDETECSDEVDPPATEARDEETGEVTPSSTEVDTMREMSASGPSTSGDDSKKSIKTPFQELNDEQSKDSSDDNSVGDILRESRAFDKFFRNLRMLSPCGSPVKQLPEDEIYSSDNENKDQSRNRRPFFNLKSPADTSESEILSSGLSDVETNSNSGRSSATGTESSSEHTEQCRMLQTDKSKSPAKSTSGNETSCSPIMSETSQQLHAGKSKPHKVNNSSPERGCNLVVSCLTEAEKSKSPPDAYRSSSENSEICRINDRHLGTGMSSSENSETSRETDSQIGIDRSVSEIFDMSRITDVLTPMSSLECDISDSETRSSSIFSDTCSESPPQITSEPKSEASGVFKVPTLRPGSAKTPKKSPNSSNLETSGNKCSGGSPKRPSDLNVARTRSRFLSISPSSRTNLELRLHRSLPNMNRPPRNEMISRSMDYGIAKSGVVRSLFTGNLNSDQPTSSGAEISNTPDNSPNSGNNRELDQNSNVERVSENIPESFSEVTLSKSKACRKLTYTPTDKEANVDETLKKDSWMEEYGDVSELDSKEVLLTPDGSAREDISKKRKVSSPEIPECTSPKKPRPSSASDSQNISERFRQLEQIESSSSEEKPKDLLQIPNRESQNTCQKRKAEDLDCSSNSEASFSDGPKEDKSPESAIKRKKLKPPTPSDKTGASSSSPDPSKESDTEEK